MTEKKEKENITNDIYTKPKGEEDNTSLQKLRPIRASSMDIASNRFLVKPSTVGPEWKPTLIIIIISRLLDVHIMDNNFAYLGHKNSMNHH